MTQGHPSVLSNFLRSGNTPVQFEIPSGNVAFTMMIDNILPGAVGEPYRERSVLQKSYDIFRKYTAVAYG